MKDPIIHLNGEYLLKSRAAMSIEDRGTMFGDGVYEVTRYYNGKPFELNAHLARLRRSMEGIGLAEPPGVTDLPRISDGLIERNGWPDATVYWQVTRGPAVRDRLYPETPHPTVLAIACPAAPLRRGGGPAAASAMLAEDTRWSNCHIKALVLLPTVLTRNEAEAAGFDDAIYHRDGVVTEATGANLFLVRGGELHTHPADRWILGGITRGVTLELADSLGMAVHERAFCVDQMLDADEVFLTGTTTQITAVTRIGDREFSVGALTTRLHQAFERRVIDACR